MYGMYINEAIFVVLVVVLMKCSRVRSNYDYYLLPSSTIPPAQPQLDSQPQPQVYSPAAASMLLFDETLSADSPSVNNNYLAGSVSAGFNPEYVAEESVEFMELNQIIIFNIGDIVSLENITRSYRQKFDQETINYCNFDPNFLTNKNKKLDGLFSMANSYYDQPQLQSNFNVNIFLRGGVFNHTSQITGN